AHAACALSRALRLAAPVSVFFRLPPSSPLFPYPPLFRPHLSRLSGGGRAAMVRVGARQRGPSRRGESRVRARGRSSSHATRRSRSEEHTSELQSLTNLVCRLLLEKKKKIHDQSTRH